MSPLFLVFYAGTAATVIAVLGFDAWRRRRDRKRESAQIVQLDEQRKLRAAFANWPYSPPRAKFPPVAAPLATRSLSLVDREARPWADTRVSVPLVEIYQDTAPTHTPRQHDDDA